MMKRTTDQPAPLSDSDSTQDRVTVTVSIDTEEDNWGAYSRTGATTTNILHLEELQELFDRWGARPTYLVNRAPLREAASVGVLGRLSENEAVEIGAHCHPWNTPPFDDADPVRTMMCNYSEEENRGKLAEVVRCLREELGVSPNAFRAGRWGFGPTVAGPLLEEGFEIDCSVSPFIDWTPESGPDYSTAPNRPYRFDPDRPLVPKSDGRLLQLPTTVGYLSGDARRRNHLRRGLERSVLRHFKVVGVLDRLSLLARRWLSPEGVDGPTMVRLVDGCVASGQRFLQLTFHSCTLLPGATPFVRDAEDRRKFMASIDRVLEHCHGRGFDFRTLSEAGRELGRPAS